IAVGGSTGQLYKIDPTTAAASAFGSAFSTTLSGTQFDMDFDPVADQIRVTSDAGENFRLSPTTGTLVATDTPINPTGVSLVGLAYDRNVKGATKTTAYGYDFNFNRLVTLGSVNGSPTSPNSGTVTDLGATNITAQQAGNLGFDIDAD